MCFSRHEREEIRVERISSEREDERAPERPEPWRNTAPRGNGERDTHDVERAEERMGALVGH